MDKLKKAFEAARGFRGHTLEDACEELGVSRTFLRMFWNGATSNPLEKKIKTYISEAGLVRSIRELGLEPDQRARQPVN